VVEAAAVNSFRFHRETEVKFGELPSGAVPNQIIGDLPYLSPP